MLSLSQTTGYAIQALSFLSPDRSRLVREVAEATGIGKPYLAKIFHLLASTDLIITKRGYQGGIQLGRPASQISLLQIVNAVEGEAWTRRCLLGMRDCDPQNMCPCHDMWAEMKARIIASLEKITLADVSSLSAGQHWDVAAEQSVESKWTIGMPPSSRIGSLSGLRSKAKGAEVLR